MKKLFSSVALVIAAAYAADDEPLMKEGLWSMHIVTTQAPEIKPIESTVSLCRNHAYDTRVPPDANGAKDTKVISKSSAGGTTTTEMQSTINGTAIRIKVTVTMKGDNEAHTIIQSTFTPPMHGISGTNVVTDMKYIGNCPAGVVPGDIVGADGTITHTWKH